MQISHLDHLVLTTSNFELCVWFYRDVLGMELLCQDDHYAFRFGMQKINVHRYPAEFLPAAGNVAYGSLDICLLTVTELPIVYQELAKRAKTVTEVVYGIPVERKNQKRVIREKKNGTEK